MHAFMSAPDEALHKKRYVCMHTFVFIHVFTHVCMYVCTHTHTHTITHTHTHILVLYIGGAFGLASE